MEEPRFVLAENAGLFTLDGTRTYVVGRERVAVIDPGPRDSRHRERVLALVRGARAGIVLLTHGHADHAEGADELALAAGFPVAGNVPGVERPLAGGERVQVDGGWIEAVATPGHARWHLAYLHRTDGASAGGDLFAGDLLLGRGSTTWVGEYSGCVRDYLDSLDRVEALGPARVLPAHGPALERPGEAIHVFRAHRRARLRQVERALARPPGAPRAPGETDPEALVERLVDRVYGGALPSKAREGARWSVRAALEYLGVAPFPAAGAPTESGDRLAPAS